MAQCPVCNVEIKDDFGLVTCPSCGAQVMIEFEGAVPSAGHSTVHSTVHSTMVQPMAEEISNVIQEELLLSASEAQPMTTPDLSDIADYGNSAASRGNEGMLRFNIFIVGIDSADIRKLVFDALIDERFLWDPEKIIASVANGQLQLNEITAVKSALLVQRLRAVPVEIRWEQYAIHQN